MNTIKLIILISWFISGVITSLMLWISDMRDQKYDENYFNVGNVVTSFLIISCGYLSAVISIFAFEYNHRLFTRLIYKIANIGVKKNK